MTDVKELAEMDERGADDDGNVDNDGRIELLTKLDGVLDAIEESVDVTEEMGPDDNVDAETMADEVVNALLLPAALETAEDTAEDSSEDTEVNAEETGGAELNSLDTALDALSTLDGAASTKDASWMRPSATRRPVESFMVSDAGVQRDFSAPPLRSYTNQEVAKVPRTRLPV